LRTKLARAKVQRRQHPNLCESIVSYDIAHELFAIAVGQQAFLPEI
jgi:hypothetical protein